MGLLLMCLATISSWSRNSCTMLMLSRCSKRIKSCDNSIGKLGAIMENAESASRLMVTWSSQTTLVWASLRVWDKPQSWFGCLQESLSPFWQWWHICYFVWLRWNIMIKSNLRKKESILLVQFQRDKSPSCLGRHSGSQPGQEAERSHL